MIEEFQTMNSSEHTLIRTLQKNNEIFNAKFDHFPPLLEIHKALNHTQGRIPGLK